MTAPVGRPWGRRTVLSVLGLTPLSACTTEPGADTGRAAPTGGPQSDRGEALEEAMEAEVMAEHLAYGDDPAQFGRLYRPLDESRGTVVVVHGGFWKAQYDASLGDSLARDLSRRGWTAWNIEYRRVGMDGGGFPGTLDDVAAAIDHLRGLDVPTGPLVGLGHSAGGHLVAWAGARGRFDRWRGGLELTHVVPQAGVLDLTEGARSNIGTGAVVSFMGATPEEAPGDYDLADPMRHVALEQPVWAVHSRDDITVPFQQSADYVEATRAAGGTAQLVEVPGGHFGVIDVTTDAWARIVEVLDQIG